jgi:PAS domain S-box-containing protein
MLMRTAPKPPLEVCLALTRAIARTTTVEEIYGIALDALADGLGVSRASILLFDPDGVMRFKAYRGLSDGYRHAVEGHTPWTPDSPNPQPIVVRDVAREPSLAALLPVVRKEGIAGMAFIPLVASGRVIGKFMLYFETPRLLAADELQLAGLIASQVAFAVERTRAAKHARRSEERLRFALDAAAMGTWDWDLETGLVQWSPNLERLHGLPAGSFDGTFASYEREIHPDDRDRVLASARRAIAEGTPHDVEYRIVAPDGTVRWIEGKGRVEYEDQRPVRLTGVCMLVTPRKEAEAARLAAAEEAGRLKDEFLATLSHELRTPLNAILGWTEILQSGALNVERTRDALEVIGRNARVQAQLIEDILDVSRIITGKMELERVPVHLPHLLETLVHGALPTAHGKGLTLTSHVARDLPPVEGDPRRLHQVFGNVLSNAMKFTPSGGTVALRGFARSGTIVVEVADTGAGIDPDFLPFVFDRFRQADCRSTRRHGGLGLGLAIARHLVEDHGGTVRADSAGSDRGTTITIELPIVAALTAASEPAPPLASRPEAPLRLDGCTVVVVDDQPDSCQLLAALVEQAGGRPVRCSSAAAALQALDLSAADLLIADLAMPELDGYDLVRQVRRRFNEIPAVAVTAFARSEDRTRALEAGYDGYCTKPIDVAAFLDTVRGALGR